MSRTPAERGHAVLGHKTTRLNRFRRDAFYVVFGGHFRSLTSIDMIASRLNFYWQPHCPSVRMIRAQSALRVLRLRAISSLSFLFRYHAGLHQALWLHIGLCAQVSRHLAMTADAIMTWHSCPAKSKYRRGERSPPQSGN